MISAISSREDRALETFRLVLVLASQNVEPPDGLTRYFREILQQAFDLVASPRESARKTKSEAILLAMIMVGNDELKARLDAIAGSPELEAEKAAQALSSLERVGDARHQFADIGEAVRATL